jgi:Family of unknown function (DUF6206)
VSVGGADAADAKVHRGGATASPPAPDALPDDELVELERLVQQALQAGEEAELEVLGYGEISLVLAWPPDHPRFACKRLPVFRSREQFNRYRRNFDDYLEALRGAGVRPVDSSLRPVGRADGTVAGYAVQPVLPARTLATNRLAIAEPAEGHPLVRAVVDATAGVVGPQLGIDAQLSNWTWEDDQLSYLDLSTPMLWSTDGTSLLDVDLLVRPIPWLLRGAIKRFVAPRILDGYRDLRGVYLDLCGNLIKQGLESWLPTFVERANRHLERPMTSSEVRRYYRSDARLWGALLRLRMLDRTWQRRVRGRPYPFLLPRETQR